MYGEFQLTADNVLQSVYFFCTENHVGTHYTLTGTSTFQHTFCKKYVIVAQLFICNVGNEKWCKTFLLIQQHCVYKS